MLLFLSLFGFVAVLGAFYVANDERKVRNEKLKKIQREIARREAVEESQLSDETQD